MKIRLLATLTGHSGPVYDLCYDARNHRIFSASADKKVASWSTTTHQNIPPNITMPYTVFAMALDTENQRLWLGGSTGNLHVVSLQEKQELKNFEVHQSPIFKILYIPKKQMVVAADGKGVLSLWDSNTLAHKVTLPLSDTKIRALRYTESTDLLTVGLSNGMREQISLTNLNSESKKAVSNYVEPINDVLQHLTTGNWIYALKNGHLLFVNEAKDKVLDLPAHNYGIYRLALLNGGRHLVSCSRDKSLKLWNLSDFKVTQKIEAKDQGHSRSVNTLCPINDTQFCSGGDDGVLKIWELTAEA